MATFRAHELDEFVAECDRLGGLGDPRAATFLADFRIEFETVIDTELDPFSDAYFAAQVSLYRELSGRELSQETGEQMPLDVGIYAAAANPYNSSDVRFLSKHNRTVITCLMMANMPPGARVLDAGSGWGLSSEAFARCGASVTAIDINPLFVELVQQRANRLGLPIEAVCSEFDTFNSDDKFDLLFFYECLHHSLKPWETLARLARFVENDGKIIFAGEPINTYWWKHWGLRLDPHSIYCIRKFGWWESGWSAEFIQSCFSRNGLHLTIHHHAGLDNGMIGVAMREGSSATFDLTSLEPFRQCQALLTESRTESDRLKSEIDYQQGEIERIRAEVERHKVEVKFWRREYEHWRHEAHNLRSKLEISLQEVKCLRSSRSWKITAPLRKLCQVLGASRV